MPLHLRKEPPYDLITAFTPISMVGSSAFFCSCMRACRLRRCRIFELRAREPGKGDYATGNGTSVLATAQLALAEKLDSGKFRTRRRSGYRGPNRWASTSDDRDAGERHATSAGRKIARACNSAITSECWRRICRRQRDRLERAYHRHGDLFGPANLLKKLLIASLRR